MKIKSETINTTPLRRLEIELTVERAEALARVLMDGLAWARTEAEDELSALYDALTYDLEGET